MTPYPKWCWVFHVGVGMAVTMAIPRSVIDNESVTKQRLE